jgi:phosphoserine phosphatase
MKFPFALACLFIAAGVACKNTIATEPLASWNDTPTKAAIVNFVQRVTEKDSPDFIPIDQRIATFDNDGTLWSEQPAYFQTFFIIDRIRSLSAEHPEWETREPFASAIKGDLKAVAACGHQGLLELTMATHAGMTTEQFDQIVKDWIDFAKHPQKGLLLKDMVYQPMLEMLDYLNANGFKTFIVSGGGIDFMRPWTQEVYGIPPEQVIGSSLKTKFEIRDGRSVLVRLPEMNFVNDKAGKPVAIHHHIGRRPVMAFGNSDGDLEMLQWTSDQVLPNLAVIIHHTDAEREYAYDRQSAIGRLDKAMDVAKQKGWPVVDMKLDWNRIYPARQVGRVRSLD